MLNLETFKKPLTAEGDPGLDTLDPRFQEIVGQVQGGAFEEAAAQVQKVNDEGIYDIRLLGYFFYGVFVERGLPALGEIFECLNLLLKESWEAVGPVKKKERHAANALLWLLSRLIKRLEHEQDRSTPEWETWLAEVNVDAAAELAERIDEFRRALSGIADAAKVLQLLPKLSAWVTAYQKLVPAEPEPEPQPEPQPDTAQAAEEAAAPPAGARVAAQPAAQAGPVIMAAGGGEAALPMIQGSHLMRDLIAKLEAFDTLGKRKEFEKAAVVATDVNRLIEEFDPRAYLPALFATYYKRLSAIIDEIAPHLEDEESLRWRYLSELYRVDLKAFTEP